MSDKLKVAVIGVGGIAHTHMPGWAATPYAEVVAGGDANSAYLQTWGAEFGIERLTTQIDELILDPTIDIVDICTPNNYHAPIAIAALKAGKHVICEKPLAPTPDLIRQMIAARDESGKLLMTAQHFRYSGRAQRMKAALETGALGEIYHARAWMLRRAAAPVRPGFVLQRHATGGAAIDIGVHTLDLALWFMNHPRPVSVTGVARRELAQRSDVFTVLGESIPPEMDVEEFASAFIRFENGAALILEVSWLLHHALPAENDSTEDLQVWLYGTQGGAHWPKCELYSSHAPTQTLRTLQLEGLDDAHEPHAEECIAFAEAIIEGRPSPIPPEQSLQVMAILNAIYESQATGREVLLV